MSGSDPVQNQGSVQPASRPQNFRKSILQVSLPSPQAEPQDPTSFKKAVFEAAIKSAIKQVKKHLNKLGITGEAYRKCLKQLKEFIALLRSQNGSSSVEIQFVYNSTKKDYEKIVILRKSNRQQGRDTKILHVFEIGINGQKLSVEVLLLQFLLKKSGYAMEGARWGVMDNTTASALYQYMSTYSVLSAPDIKHAPLVLENQMRNYNQVLSQIIACRKDKYFPRFFSLALQDKFLSLFDRLINIYERVKGYEDALHSDIKNPRYAAFREKLAEMFSAGEVPSNINRANFIKLYQNYFKALYGNKRTISESIIDRVLQNKNGATSQALSIVEPKIKQYQSALIARGQARDAILDQFLSELKTLYKHHYDVVAVLLKRIKTFNRPIVDILRKKLSYLDLKIRLYKKYAKNSKKSNRYLEEALTEAFGLLQRLKAYQAHMPTGEWLILKNQVNQRIVQINSLIFGNFSSSLNKFRPIFIGLYNYYFKKIYYGKKSITPATVDLVLYDKNNSTSKALLIVEPKIVEYQKALIKQGKPRDFVLDQFLYWIKRIYIVNSHAKLADLYSYVQKLRGKNVNSQTIKTHLLVQPHLRHAYFSTTYAGFVNSLNNLKVSPEQKAKIDQLLGFLKIVKDLHENGPKYQFSPEEIDPYQAEKNELLHQAAEHIRSNGGDIETKKQILDRHDKVAYRIFKQLATSRIAAFAPHLISILISYLQKQHGVSAKQALDFVLDLFSNGAGFIVPLAREVAASQDQASRGIERTIMPAQWGSKSSQARGWLLRKTGIKILNGKIMRGSEELYSAVQNLLYLFYTEITSYSLAQKKNRGGLYVVVAQEMAKILKLLKQSGLSQEEQVKALRILENVDFSSPRLGAQQIAQSHDAENARAILRNKKGLGDSFVQRVSSMAIDGRFLGNLVDRYAKAEVIPQLLSFEAMLELSELTTFHLAAEAKAGKHRVVLAYLKACNSPIAAKIEKGQALNKEEAIILGSLLFDKKYDQAALDKARALLAQTILTDAAIKALNNNYFICSRDGYIEYVSPADKARYTQGQNKASLVEVKPGGTIESEDKQTVLEDRPLVVYKMILLKQFSSTSGGVEFRLSRRMGRKAVVPAYLDANDVSNIAGLFSRKHFKLADQLAVTKFEKRSLRRLIQSGQLTQAEKVVFEKIYRGESTYSVKDIELLRAFKFDRLKQLMAQSPIEEKQWLTTLYMKLKRALLMISRINGLSSKKRDVLKKLAGEMALRKGIHIIDLSLHVRPYYSGSKLSKEQQEFNQLYLKAMKILRDVHYQLILASKKYHEEDQKPKGGKTRWESLQNFVGFHYRTIGKLMFQTIKPPSPLLMTYLGIGSTDALMVKYLLYPKLAAKIVKLTNEVKSMDETIKKETQQFDFKEYHRIYKEIKANREALEELLKNKKTELGKDKKEFLDGILGELRRLENLLNYGVVSPIQVFYLLADIKVSIEKLTLVKFLRQEAVLGKDKAPEVLGKILANLNQLKSLMNNFTVRSNKLKEIFIQRQEKAIQLQELQTRLLSENLTREDWIRLRLRMVALFPQSIRGKVLAWAGRLISGEEQEVSRPDKSVIHQSPLQLIDAYFAAKADKAAVEKILGSNWKHLFVEFVGKVKKNQKPQLVFLPHIGEKQIREMVTDKTKQAQLLAIYRLASLRILSMGGGAVPGEDLAATYAKTAYSLVMMSIPRKIQANYLRLIPSLFFPTTSLHGIFSFVRDPLAIIGGALPGVSLTFGNRTIDDIKNLTSFKLLAQKALSWGALATDAHQTQNLAGSLHMVLMQYSRNGSEHIARLFSRMIDKNVMPWDKFRVEDVILLYFYLTTELIPAMKNNPELRNKILALLNVKREIKINPFSEEYMSKLRELIVNLIKEHPEARKLWNGLAGKDGIKAESLSATSFDDPKGQDTEILKKFMEKVIKDKVFFFEQELPESAQCKKLTGFWGQRSVLLSHLSYVVESLFKIVEVINKTNAYIDPTRQEYNNFDLGYFVEEATGQKDVRKLQYRSFEPRGVYAWADRKIGDVKEHSAKMANAFIDTVKSPKKIAETFGVIAKGKVEGVIKFEYTMAKHIALGFANMWAGLSAAAAARASGDEKAFLEGMFRFYKGTLETGASFFVFESMPAVFYLDVLRLVQKKEYAKALAMAWAILSMSHLSLLSFLRISRKIGLHKAMAYYVIAGQMQPVADTANLANRKFRVWSNNGRALWRRMSRMLSSSDARYAELAKQSLENYGNSSLFSFYAMPYWMHQGQLMHRTGYKILYYAANPLNIPYAWYRLMRDYIVYDRNVAMRVLPGYSYGGPVNGATPQVTSAPIGAMGKIWRYGMVLPPHYARRAVAALNPHNYYRVRRGLGHVTEMFRRMFQAMIPKAGTARVDNFGAFEAKFNEINTQIAGRFAAAGFAVGETLGAKEAGVAAIKSKLAQLHVQKDSQMEFIISRQRNINQLQLELARVQVAIDNKYKEMEKITAPQSSKRLTLAKEILKLQEQASKLQFRIYSILGDQEALKMLAQDYRKYQTEAYERAAGGILKARLIGINPEFVQGLFEEYRYKGEDYIRFKQAITEEVIKQLNLPENIKNALLLAHKNFTLKPEERAVAQEYAEHFNRLLKIAEKAGAVHDVHAKNRAVFPRETFFKLLDAVVSKEPKVFNQILRDHNRANQDMAYKLSQGGYKSLYQDFQRYSEVYKSLGDTLEKRQQVLEAIAKQEGIVFSAETAGAKLDFSKEVPEWVRFKNLDVVQKLPVYTVEIGPDGKIVVDASGKPKMIFKDFFLTSRQIIELLWASTKQHIAGNETLFKQTLPWLEASGLRAEDARGLAQSIMQETGKVMGHNLLTRNIQTAYNVLPGEKPGLAAPVPPAPQPAQAPASAAQAPEPAPADSPRLSSSHPIVVEKPFIETGSGRVDFHRNIGLPDEASRRLAAIQVEQMLTAQNVFLDGNKRVLVYQAGRDTNCIIYEPLPDGKYQVYIGQQAEILTAEQFEKFLKGQMRSPGLASGPVLQRMYPGRALPEFKAAVKEIRNFQKIQALAKRYKIQIHDQKSLRRITQRGFRDLYRFLADNPNINYSAIMENKNFQKWLIGTRSGRMALQVLNGQRPGSQVAFSTFGGIVVGMAVALGAEKVAYILGIKNQYARFAFVLACGHAAMVASRSVVTLEGLCNIFIRANLAYSTGQMSLLTRRSAVLPAEGHWTKRWGMGALNIVKGLGYGIYVSNAYGRLLDNIGVNKDSWLRSHYTSLGVAIAAPAIGQGVLNYIEKGLARTTILGSAPKLIGRAFGVVTWGALALDMGSSLIISDYRKSFLQRLVDKVRVDLIRDAEVSGSTMQWVLTLLPRAQFAVSDVLLGHFSRWVFEKLNTSMDHVVKPAIKEILLKDLERAKEAKNDLANTFSLLLTTAQKAGLRNSALDQLLSQKVVLTAEEQEKFNRYDKLRKMYTNEDSIDGEVKLYQVGRISKEVLCFRIKSLLAMAQHNFPDEKSLMRNISNRLNMSEKDLYNLIAKQLASRFQQALAANKNIQKTMHYYAAKIQMPFKASRILSFANADGTLKSGSFEKLSFAVQEVFNKQAARRLAFQYKKNPQNPAFKVLRAKLRLKLWQKLGTMKEIAIRRQLVILGDDFKWLEQAQKGNLRYLKRLARTEARIIIIRTHYESRILKLNEASRREANLLKNNDPALAKKLKVIQNKYGPKMIRLMMQCRMDLAAQDIRLASLGGLNKAGRS